MSHSWIPVEPKYL